MDCQQDGQTDKQINRHMWRSRWKMLQNTMPSWSQSAYDAGGLGGHSTTLKFFNHWLPCQLRSSFEKKLWIKPPFKHSHIIVFLRDLQHNSTVCSHLHYSKALKDLQGHLDDIKHATVLASMLYKMKDNHGEYCKPSKWVQHAEICRQNETSQELKWFNISIKKHSLGTWMLLQCTSAGTKSQRQAANSNKEPVPAWQNHTWLLQCAPSSKIHWRYL